MIGMQVMIITAVISKKDFEIWHALKYFYKTGAILLP